LLWDGKKSIILLEVPRLRSLILWEEMSESEDVRMVISSGVGQGNQYIFFNYCRRVIWRRNVVALRSSGMEQSPTFFRYITDSIETKTNWGGGPYNKVIS
jgi:hypothetical protein